MNHHPESSSTFSIPSGSVTLDMSPRQPSKSHAKTLCPLVVTEEQNRFAGGLSSIAFPKPKSWVWDNGNIWHCGTPCQPWVWDNIRHYGMSCHSWVWDSIWHCAIQCREILCVLLMQFRPTSAELMCTHNIYPHHIYAVDNRSYMVWTTVVHNIW